MIDNFEYLNMEDLMGITILKLRKKDTYIIVEGHARMVAIYNKLIIKKEKLRYPIEISIGFIEKDNWIFSPFNN